MDIKYITRVLGGATFHKMFEKIDLIHEKTGKNKMVLFFDMIGCALKYGAGYNDYIIFEYYNMKASERKTYLTRIKNKKLVTMMNDPKYSPILDQKNLFHAKFRDFLGREVLDLEQADFARFQEFIADKDYVFAKPYIGESGKGIEKLRVADYDDAQAMWDYVTNPEKNFGLLEQMIVQHPQAAAIYPHSLNCLRVVTLVNNGEAHILYAVFKTGNNGHFVDNLESGGVACHFDLDKGEIIGPGHTSALINHDVHPATGIRFVGYQLPFADEVKALVKKAAMVMPECRYIGWDVCLTPDGPAIVEGNDYPAYDFPQLPDDDKPRIGLLPKIEQFGIKL